MVVLNTNMMITVQRRCIVYIPRALNKETRWRGIPLRE